MKAKAQLKSYEELEFAITLTGTVSDWRALKRQLDKLNDKALFYAWPLSGLTSAVDSVLVQLDKTHEASVQKEETK